MKVDLDSLSLKIGVLNNDSADNFATHQYAPTEDQFDNGKPFSDITAMFSVNNAQRVSDHFTVSEVFIQ